MENPRFLNHNDLEQIKIEFGTPCFVYDESIHKKWKWCVNAAEREEKHSHRTDFRVECIEYTLSAFTSQSLLSKRLDRDRWTDQGEHMEVRNEHKGWNKTNTRSGYSMNTRESETPRQLLCSQDPAQDRWVALQDGKTHGCNCYCHHRRQLREIPLRN